MIFLVAMVDDSWLWHTRFCHINFDNIVKIGTKIAVRYLPKIVKPTNMVCKQFFMRKKKKSYFLSNKFTTFMKLVIVHIDLSGPTKTTYFYGERYFMILVDDFTRIVWLPFL